MKKWSAGQRSKKNIRIIREESIASRICQCTENDFASGCWISRIQLHSLEGETNFKTVNSPRIKKIIIGLLEILVKVEPLDLIQPRLNRCKARHIDLGIVSARALAQCGVCRQWIDRLLAQRSVKRPIESDTGRINQLGAEDVSLFDGNVSATRGIRDQHIVCRIRLRGRC